jgi:hypothetical protein
MMPSWAEKSDVPRAMAVEFLFGHSLGLPWHLEMQTMVIKDALKVLEQSTEANTIVHAECSWPGDESYWRRQWQPAAASPLVAKYLHEIRAMRP